MCALLAIGISLRYEEMGKSKYDSFCVKICISIMRERELNL